MLFTKKLKPYELNLPKEDLIKLANMTIEEKIAQQKEKQGNKPSRNSMIRRFRRLRGIKRHLTPSQMAPKVANVQMAPIYMAKGSKEM